MDPTVAALAKAAGLDKALAEFPADIEAAAARRVGMKFQFLQHLKKTNQPAITYLELSDVEQKYGIVVARCGIRGVAFRTGGRS